LVGYPAREEEMEVLELHDRGDVAEGCAELRPVLTTEELRYLRGKVKEVRVDAKLKAFIVDLVAATRTYGGLYLGASPRASLALMNGAKAFAAIQGRDFVTPEDVLALVAPVLRHRVQLSAEKELEGMDVDRLIGQLASRIEIPR
nr:MoxR family ATPase [Odoribacter sp.]